MRNVFLISIIIVFIFPTHLFAQQTQKNLYLTLGFGGTSYRGDLTNSFESWGGTFHTGLVFNKKKRVNGYIHLMIGGVRGNNDSYVFNSTQTTTPNTYFKTSLISLGYELRINIFKKENYSLYVSPGIALLRYDPKDEFKNSYSNQFSTRAAGEIYSNVSLMLPIKIGGTYYLKNGYGIGVDAGFLNPLTDYIDNISQWGNKSKKDNLLQLNLLLYIPLK
ncbi:outer membrane beta-barrel protein [Cytophaga aurantiaca]|uniref:outer membrane beta-barrel protein n=1 Tax=Cytophaga aurantiaca TaxID=29530 RepID=UPI0003707D8A|nr:hypothetical protein [Cytophaga aurantiaca]